MNGPPQPTNGVEVLNVAELDRLLRNAVERASGYRWVEGEVASLRTAGSGHTYFALKDEREDAVIDCVMYRLQAGRARRHLRDGARIQIFGRATVWAPRGRLQFIAEAVRPAGRGALLAALEVLKEKLKDEGLFDREHKRRLPSHPCIVGIVTSAHGAAIHDILSVGFRRGGCRFVLSPAVVQGDGAAASICRALDRLERYPGIEVVIIGRGGGSGEDLMAFNDEVVVRRVAALKVPVVSAVGHEIDTTLTDLVADVRAATPSQAAELVVPDERAQLDSLRRCTMALARAMRARVLEDTMILQRLRAKVGDPRFLIAEKQQYVDDLSIRLERVSRRGLTRKRTVYEQLYGRLSARHPRTVIARSRVRLGPLQTRLDAAMRVELSDCRALLAERGAELEGLSPLRILGRGYAIASRPDGVALRSAAEAKPGDAIQVRLHEGRLDAVVERTISDEVLATEVTSKPS